MSVLCGVDPGVNSGFAVKLPDGSYHTATLNAPENLWDMVRSANPKMLALEVFSRSNRIDANMVHTMEMVGSIRGICHILGIKCYGQENQTRRSFIPDAVKVLTAQGRKVVMTKDEDDHEVDALSHLLLLEWRIANNKLEGKWRS